jgi:hypothetical protein
MGFQKSNIFKKIMVRGRHFNLAIILALQYMHQTGPNCRSQFSYILCGQSNAQGLKLLCDEFQMGNISKKQFIEMYHLNTRDNRFLCICCDSVQNNDDINEIYGSIKANV